MKRLEWTARVLIGTLVLAAAGTPLWFGSRTPLIHARMADAGGWTPDVLHAQAGQPLHLRLTSDDVMHGFAVGQMEMQSVDVEPGKVTDVTLTFQKPGTYTFYCTRWCGINHWRMRGTVEVSGGQGESPAARPPLYASLGLNLDASHEAAVVPVSRPSAMNSQQFIAASSVSKLVNVDFYRSHSPYEAWSDLRGNPSLAGLGDQQVWNLVAFIWQANTNAQDVAEGRILYAQNCAACHGESGRGNGVFADALAAQGQGASQAMMIRQPANFTDPGRMLGASPALLEGKILRGGMGTGMPSWGPIFREDQMWKIVSYLYTFQFEEFSQ